MVTPITLRVLSTFYPHLGAHAGMRQVCSRFDTARVRYHEQLVTKQGDGLPLPFRAARRLTRRWFSAPPQQYMLEDWLAERECLRACRDSAVDVVQFMDAEHSLRHLPRWMSGWSRRPPIVGLYHFPPDVARVHVAIDVLRTLDAVMAVGGEQAEWLQSLVPSTRVHLVRHGVDEAFFHPAADGPPAGPPWRVLTVGGHLRDHALFLAVAEALCGTSDIECHAVFRPPPGMVLPPNVHLHTHISDDELAALYRRSHVCFLPFQQITASNALLEAMSSGLPVVMPELKAARTYADERHARLFPVGDIDGAVDHIRALLADPAARQALGTAGRQAALRCTWSDTAKTMTAVYASLVGGASGPGPTG